MVIFHCVVVGIQVPSKDFAKKGHVSLGTSHTGLWIRSCWGVALKSCKMIRAFSVVKIYTDTGHALLQLMHSHEENLLFMVSLLPKQ